MEFDQHLKYPFPKENPSDVGYSFIDEKTVNFRKIIEKYLFYWKWFLLSIFTFLFIAFIYLRYTPKNYLATTTILIEDKENGILSSELSTFQDLGLLLDQKTSIETEITVLKSTTIMRNVIKNLGFNVTYEYDGRISDEEMYYKNIPYKVNFVTQDSLFYQLDTSFTISTKSVSKYILHDNNGEKMLEGKFGDVINSGFGNIIITPNEIDDVEIGDGIIVKISPLKGVVRYYSQQIDINFVSLKSNGLKISLIGPIRRKAEDILNELVTEYNNSTIKAKNLIARNTDEFISQRIEDVSRDLENIDKGVEDYKTDNRLTDINYEAGLILESNSQLEKRIIDLNSQIQLIDYVYNYMDVNTNDLIPANVGLRDEAASQSTLTFNELILERNRILKGSSEMNPTVVNLNEQIKTLRENIKRSLSNSRKSLSLELEESKQQERRLNAKRALAPKQEREFLDIKRRQQIVESLYLYLLQKREENAISLSVSQPNAKILDLAESSDIPVSPNKMLILALFVIFGAFIPFAIIFLNGILDNKIHVVEDLESVLKVPILGDIPKYESGKEVIISDNDSSNIAEAFRLLRTNVNFVLSGTIDKSKTIFVTSSIGGEGKTIIAINLAISLSLIDKKVLLISADIRRPRSSVYLNVKANKGLTEYLVDTNLSMNDLIVSTGRHNLDILTAGAKAPNPSELLTNGRFKKVIDYGKENYDYVVVDTAPVNLVTDTLLIAQYADSFIYVVRANYTDKQLLKNIQMLYRENRLPKMAIVLNSTDIEKNSYGYGYGYGEEVVKSAWWRKN